HSATRLPPRSALFPYTTLFRSGDAGDHDQVSALLGAGHADHQAEVGDEPVVDAKDGRAQVQGPAPVPAFGGRDIPFTGGDGREQIGRASSRERVSMKQGRGRAT